VRLGAIGLGSSNDFHKPLDASRLLAGFPSRVALDRATARDVGVVRLVEEDGMTCTRYWLLNASIGVTADANARFNRHDGLLSSLKRYSTALAILYAAASAISHARSRNLTLDGRLARTTNLGVVKSPHFAGCFRYDSPPALHNGRLAVHSCGDMAVPRLLLTLLHLARGGFTGLPRTNSWETECLTVESEERFAVEYDGEITYTRRATFSVLPRLLRVSP
jgi:diacylglycerol kinase (ATP)